MGDVLNFKCPCCGATLPFNGATGEMSCEYCGATFTMEQARAAQEAEKVDAASSDMTWTTSEQLMITDEDGKVQGYKCPSCAAEMVASDTTAATECPYCGNQAIIPQSFEGIYKPDLMIPFSVDKKTAVDALEEFTKGKKLLPDAFTEKKRIEKITGVYVPFWLYSCHAKGSVQFEGIKSKKWEDSNFKYEKKDHFNVVRRGEMDFSRIPADASSQMDDATMDSLEPFDFSKAVDYDAAYFSGYLADRYDVEEETARPRANERVENTFREKMKEHVKNYNEVTHKSDSIRLSDAKAEYAMLPVWMMSTKYEDNIYTFGVNGQTGKLVGSLPVDKGKYYKYLILTSLICMIVLSVIMALIGMMSGITAIVCLVISIIAGYLYAGSLKAAMNTIAVQTSATEYMNEGSLVMGEGDDSFLFTRTEKHAKEQKQANG